MSSSKNGADRPTNDERRPTMHDVADLAGVSLKTVSRVFNHEPNVRPEVRRRVENAVVSLGFRRNIVAKNLRTGRSTSRVGLVIADLLNPFYAAIATAVEAVANRHSATLIIGSSAEDAVREQAIVTDLLEGHVDGLIVVPTGGDHSYLEPQRRLGVHVVFVDRPAIGIEADAVVLDNLNGARWATRHLLNLGHRRIGFVGDTEILATTQERLAGYRQALHEAAVGPTEQWERLEEVGGTPTEESIRDLLAMANPPTAIITGNNRASAGAVRELLTHRRDIAFIGFDDFELADALGISVIAYDTMELGREAARLALARLDDPTGPPRHVEIPTRLIQRGSGEIPPPSTD
jgi:LacI family transcriptional regulator